MKQTVISKVVGNDLCIGCGLCAALCPQNALAMQWNRYGEYNPVEISPCITECGLCLKVCPFTDSGENEDTIGKRLYGEIPGIHHLPETGYYLASYVGYSEKHRLTSASGGIATWLLEALLVEGVVDHAICVAPTGDPDRLFSFQVFDTPEEVRTGAGSAYYPVEMSGVIRHVLNYPGRYVITGLPCFIKAIRLAQHRNKKLQECIVVTVGLVCGQMKSTHFTDYMAALAGVQGKVMSVRYRGKSPDQPVNNFHYLFKTCEGDEKKIFLRDGISEAWTNRWFTPNACNYCDDVFAECADVVCMDAWLPEYSRESEGTSLVLARSPQVRDIIERGQGIHAEAILVQKLVQSQAGVVTIKRRQLAYRMYLNREKGINSLRKRVEPERLKNPILQSEVILKDRMQGLSKEYWIVYGGEKDHFRQVMHPYLIRLDLGILLSRIITLPFGIIRKAMPGKRDE